MRNAPLPSPLSPLRNDEPQNALVCDLSEQQRAPFPLAFGVTRSPRGIAGPQPPRQAAPRRAAHPFLPPSVVAAALLAFSSRLPFFLLCPPPLFLCGPSSSPCLPRPLLITYPHLRAFLLCISVSSSSQQGHAHLPPPNPSHAPNSGGTLSSPLSPKNPSTTHSANAGNPSHLHTPPLRCLTALLQKQVPLPSPPPTTTTPLALFFCCPGGDSRRRKRQPGYAHPLLHHQPPTQFSTAHCSLILVPPAHAEMVAPPCEGPPPPIKLLSCCWARPNAIFIAAFFLAPRRRRRAGVSRRAGRRAPGGRGGRPFPKTHLPFLVLSRRAPAPPVLLLMPLPLPPVHTHTRARAQPLTHSSACRTHACRLHPCLSWVNASRGKRGRGMAPRRCRPAPIPPYIRSESASVPQHTHPPLLALSSLSAPFRSVVRRAPAPSS